MSVSSYLALELENVGVVEGSCTTEGHENEIQLLSWNHSFSQQATGAAESAFGGMSTSYAVHSPIVISKYTDKSSPHILKSCWSGDYVKKATIKSYRASGKDNVTDSTCYLQVELEDGIIADYQIEDGGDIATEVFQIKYKKCTYTFTPTDNETGAADSAIPITHDLGKNTIA